MGFDKALIPMEGQPLVLRVAERLATECDPVFLAPGEPGRLGDLGHPEVADEVAGAGALGGLVSALAASPHELLAAVAVDMPFASPEVFRLLAALHDGEDAVVPMTSRGLEPLHAVYSRRALVSVRHALEDRRFRMRTLLETLAVRTVYRQEWGRADPDGRFATNLNTGGDLASLQ
jgi:molybdopterin-guanine dinucleotide biosynthesis protein A